MADIQVNWIKYTNGNWCDFEGVTLSQITSSGVYMIWHGGDNPHVVRIGQGIVANRLAEHRDNPEITKWRQRGRLYVTWAALDARHRDRVERYLYEQWSPYEGDRHPDVIPMSVNSPWG